MKLTLTIKADYKPRRTPRKILERVLNDAAQHLASHGLLTGETDAVVDSFEVEVSDPTRQQDEMTRNIAWRLERLLTIFDQWLCDVLRLPIGSPTIRCRIKIALGLRHAAPPYAAKHPRRAPKTIK